MLVVVFIQVCSSKVSDATTNHATKESVDSEKEAV